jgi:hypothetical protein
MSYLIIHGLEVETYDLKEIAKLSGSGRIENIGSNAFRLHEYKWPHGVAEYCAKAKLDFAFVPVPRRLSDFRLVAMDMDSTLITIECIDEMAELQGIKPQVAAITASAMRGEIEYHESLRQRLALLAGMDESALQRVYDERLKLSPGAERASGCAPSASRPCSCRAASPSSPSASRNVFPSTTHSRTPSKSRTANSPARCSAASSTPSSRPRNCASYATRCT